MIVTACRYIDLKNGRSLVHCEFDVGEGRVIRCVETKDLLIESSTFIGLKFSDSLYLDTTKEPVIKKKLNLVSLFDELEDTLEESKEDTQLGLF